MDDTVSLPLAKGANLAWRLGRPPLMGVTAAVACLGLIIAPRHGLGWDTVGFLLAVVLFHYAGVLVNDVMDVDVDAMSSRRRRSPLVAGEVSPAAGLRLGMMCLSGAVLVVVGAKDARPPTVLLFVGTGSCMLAYNVYGKRVRLPLVMDVTQGVAWGLLTLWASSAVGGEIREAVVVSTAVTVYMTQVNAIHGGIRDAEIDRRAGRSTSALMLGVTKLEDGGLQVSRRLQVVAFALQAGMLLLGGVWVLASPPGTTIQVLAAGASLGIFAMGFALIGMGMRPGIPSTAREIYGARHIAFTFQAIAYLSAANGGWRDFVLAQTLGLLLVGPLLVHTSFRSMGRLSRLG